METNNEEVKSNELGYFSDGEPTDKQIQLQDEITSATDDYLKKLSQTLAEFGVAHREYADYQIETLQPVWDEALAQLDAPDSY